ncbi:MAG: hypothetical protein HKN92_04530 [Chitinophagales bacterium]|nr:hypothetical protein [Chitinophagales bacterium]
MNKNLISFILTIALMLIVVYADAQCPMCRASAESSIEGGSTNMRGINKGILYLFATPYLLVATIGFFWWRANRKSTDEEQMKAAIQ